MSFYQKKKNKVGLRALIKGNLIGFVQGMLTLENEINDLTWREDFTKIYSPVHSHNEPSG